MRVRSRREVLRRTVLAAALSTLVALPVLADVTIEQKFRNAGFGPHHIGALEGTTRTSISGERSYTGSDSKFTGKFLGHMMGEQQTAQIVRLDRELIWEMRPKKRVYSEITFEQMRKQWEEAMAKADEEMARAKSEGKEQPSEESDIEWSEPKIDVQRTGKKDTIAGFDAEEVLLTAKTTGTNKKTGEMCDVTWGMDLWNAASTPAQQEMVAFYSEYAKKLGFDRAQTERVGRQAMAMFAAYGDAFEKLQKEIEKVGSANLRSTLTLDVAGNCGATPAEPMGAEGGGSGSGESANPLAGAKKVFGKLGFGRKKKAQQEPAPEEAPAPQGGAAPRTLFELTTETVSISTSSVPGSLFDVPADYKKVDAPGLD